MGKGGERGVEQVKVWKGRRSSSSRESKGRSDLVKRRKKEQRGAGSDGEGGVLDESQMGELPSLQRGH